MVNNPKIIPFLYPIFDKINPAGNEKTKNARKMQTELKQFLHTTSRKHPLILGLSYLPKQ